MSAIELGITAAPAMPNSTRNTMRLHWSHAMPHRKVSTVDDASPMSRTRRWPWTSPILPISGVITAMASIRPVTVHSSVTTLASRSSEMVGNATVTSVIRLPNPMTDSRITHSRRRR